MEGGALSGPSRRREGRGGPEEEVDMPQLLSVSDSSADTDDGDSDAESAYDFGVATAAGRMAFVRRRHPSNPNVFAQTAGQPAQSAFFPDARRAQELLDGLELVSPLPIAKVSVDTGRGSHAVCHLPRDSDA